MLTYYPNCPQDPFFRESAEIRSSRKFSRLQYVLYAHAKIEVNRFHLVYSLA
ncbi:MAG: hypothetical protein PV344_03835 [Anaplasma sp.]|nr:hypothetical protein [Anaplasma sp.]